MNPITLADLQKFCSVDETRHELTVPFTVGDFTYATDGRTLVRVPALPEAEATPRKTEPLKFFLTDTSHFSPVLLPPGWQDFPQLKQACKPCKGTGAAGEWIDCDECDGIGEVECPEYHHEHDCEDCNGKGEIRGKVAAVCDECDGRGENDVVTPISANRGAQYFNDTYLRQIFALPGVAMTYQPGLTSEPTAFTFIGGEGRLMSLNASKQQIEAAASQWPA